MYDSANSGSQSYFSAYSPAHKHARVDLLLCHVTCVQAKVLSTIQLLLLVFVTAKYKSCTAAHAVHRHGVAAAVHSYSVTAAAYWLYRASF